MHWIAPSEKDNNNPALEKRLWDTIDTATRVSANPECEATWRDFRGAKDHWSANSGLKSQEYSAPVLGLIFLRFAEVRYSNVVAQQNLSPVLASKMDFARPPRELRQRFAAVAELMIRRMVQLYTTIQNLRRTRDLLLPRLLSGQVELNTN